MKIGDKVIVDGIPCTVFLFYNNEYYAVDDHGLSYYMFGIDEQNIRVAANYDQEYKFQWGAYNFTTGIVSEEIGAGLSNTNSLLAIPEALLIRSDYDSDSTMTVWQAIKTIREERDSNRWFVGTVQEYLQMANCIDIPNMFDPSDPSGSDYWASNEMNNTYAHQVAMDDYIASEANGTKSNSRYCRIFCTFSEDEIIGGTVTISHERNSSEIRYTDTGEDPTDNSSLYSNPITVSDGDTIKARAYEELFTPSDVAEFNVDVALPSLTNTITIGTELNDGIVVYDRGESYGDYSIHNGELIRLSKGIDTGEYNNKNWRFLVAGKNDLANSYWGLVNPYQLGANVTMGYGPSNTMRFLNAFSANTQTIWNQIYEYRKENGDKWFLPSQYEASTTSFQNYIDDNWHWCANQNAGNSAELYVVNKLTLDIIAYNTEGVKVRLMYRV